MHSTYVISSIDRSGAIGRDELQSAMKNLDLEITRDELDKIIDEVRYIYGSYINISFDLLQFV